MYVVPHVAAMLAVAQQITFTIEQGPLGGLPGVGGVAVSPTNRQPLGSAALRQV
jgi:acyl CoA:acetate/3-ketoacid CoA transferase